MSKLIEWRESFEIGMASVDFEHRTMIELINDLFAHIDQNAGNLDEQVEEFLGEIFTKISAHFALEEREMRAASYPEFASHKEDHENLLDSIRDIMDEYESDAYAHSIQRLQDQLNVWFTGHFGTKDRELHHFLGH
jgi:hemerythrin